MPISMGDGPSVTHWEETLNRAVEKAAAETGALFIDMWPSSADRDACQSVNQRWIEPLIKPANADPVHPTARVRQRWPGKRCTNSVSTNATATGDLARLTGCPLPSF